MKNIKIIISLILVVVAVCFFALTVLIEFSPKGRITNIQLPPGKTERHIALEGILEKRGLSMDEMNSLVVIINERTERWDDQLMLSEVIKVGEVGNTTKLIKILKSRGLNDSEVDLFIENTKKSMPEYLR